VIGRRIKLHVPHSIVQMISNAFMKLKTIGKGEITDVESSI